MAAVKEPVVAITATSLPEPNHMIAAGFQAQLKSSFTGDRLIEVIELVLKDDY